MKFDNINNKLYTELQIKNKQLDMFEDKTLKVFVAKQQCQKK